MTDRRQQKRTDDYPRILRWLVPKYQRATLAYHPLAFWFSCGVCLTGILQLAHPVASSTEIALPMWLRVSFNVIWTLGGALGMFGILRGKARYEAAGMMLLATGLIVDFLSILYVAPGRAWVGAGFLIALAIGCFRRAKVLTKGYEVISDERWRK